MLRMLRKDRVLLRNVVIAVVCGSVGAMTIGAVCLGRDRPAPETIILTSSDKSGAVDTTRTTSAELSQPSEGAVAPAPSPNISSTTVIVNPASSASSADNSGGTQQPPQPIIIQQAAPASAPPASTEQPQQAAAAPATTVSPESVEAQDKLDQQREQESYQQQGTQIIPVPVGNGGQMPPGTQVPMRDPNVPGANNPPSSYYPPGPSRPGQLGPNVPNGGASTLRASGGTAPQMAPFGGNAASGARR